MDGERLRRHSEQVKVLLWVPIITGLLVASGEQWTLWLLGRMEEIPTIVALQVSSTAALSFCICLAVTIPVLLLSRRVVKLEPVSSAVGVLVAQGGISLYLILNGTDSFQRATLLSRQLPVARSRFRGCR